jgi:sugar phosphate isomerase/epimerase
MSDPPPDLSRLAIHTMTTKPWSLREAVSKYEAAGVAGIGVWREHLHDAGVKEGAKLLAESKLTVASLVRGGFFASADEAKRREANDENLRCLDEAAAIGAPMLVLVPGAEPGQSLEASRGQVADGLAAILDHAQQAGVKLALEPLHPMYAARRSCIFRLGEALDVCERIDDERLGVAVDVYHLWWDADLEAAISRGGRMGRLLGFHLSDWRTETRDLLFDRGLMGEGCIDIPRIRGWMERADFDGFHEVEIFSHEYWSGDQDTFLANILRAYRECC